MYFTLEPLELGLPFTGPYGIPLLWKKSQDTYISQHRAGVRLYTLCFHLAKSCDLDR